MSPPTAPPSPRPPAERVGRALHAALHASGPAAAAEAARDVARGAAGRPVVAVSACLLGMPTRHDATARQSPRVLASLQGAVLLPLCPEVLGGMGCPRPPVEWQGGDGAAALTGRAARAVDADGDDHTAALLAGARRALALAQAAGATRAVLKERSPTCGCRTVHQDGAVRAGRGAFAALAADAGIACLGDEDLVLIPDVVKQP